MLTKEIEAASIADWNDYLEEFREEIYPRVFKDNNVSFEIALLLWDMNKMLGYLKMVHEDLHEPEDDYKK